jgi:para-aminobenzoate synthetase / 4-amino-4-deoxychorismate lyase
VVLTKTAPNSQSGSAPNVFLQDRVGHHIRQKRFLDPLGTIRCDTPDTFTEALSAIEAERSKGFHLAGYISYEAGYLTEPSLTHLIPGDRKVPLIWMGVFKTMEEEITHPSLLPSLGRLERPALTHIVPQVGEPDFYKAIRRIRAYIEAGDIYQANYTFQTDLTLKGHPLDYFLSLTHAQPVPYAAYIETGEETVLSLSPELFFEVSNGKIKARPMKGTARRGRTSQEDEEIADKLANDPKERAENLMILDLMRNDISRIAKPGSLDVPARFSIERYRTVHQMTSTVTADLKNEIDFPTLLRSIFPCGSITGAPKVRAMEIIRELESSPRGVYTGAIGHLAPDGKAAFNVAIRTLTLTRKEEHLWTGNIGVGGGIVYDSTPQGEFDECQIKLSFLKRQSKGAFDLIETLKRSEDGTFFLLEAHLERLQGSARFFDYPFDRHAVQTTLETRSKALGSGTWRIRLLLKSDGTLEISQTELSTETKTASHDILFRVSDQPIDSQNTFIYHKTTRRDLFDTARTKAQRNKGCDEVLFLNEKGEVTEGTISNLFIRKGGRFLTPPISCGLLAGTLRAHLLADPSLSLCEEILTLDDVLSADEIFFGNSVRGLQKARLLPETLQLAGE